MESGFKPRAFYRVLSILSVSAASGLVLGSLFAFFLGLTASAPEPAVGAEKANSFRFSSISRFPATSGAKAGENPNTGEGGAYDPESASRAALKRLSAKEVERRQSRGLPLARIPVKKSRPTVQGLRHVRDVSEEDFARKVEGEYQSFFGSQD